MGKLVGKVGQALGVMADPNAGAGAMGQARALEAEAVDLARKLELPEIEKMRVDLLQYAPELVGLLEEQQLGPSAYEDIQVDPRLQQDQLSVLDELKQRGETGFTPEDRARYESLRRQAAGDEQARQASILNEMAQRGTLDSGSQLAMQIASSQASADRQRQQGEQMAADAASARRASLQQAGQLAGQMSQQDLDRQSRVATARDQVEQFNAQNRAQTQASNLAARQGIANLRGQIGQTQEQQNKGLYQQQYQNQLGKLSAITGGLQNQSRGMQQTAQSQAQAAQQHAAGVRGLYQTAASAYAGGANGGGMAGAMGAASASDGVIKGNSYNMGGISRLEAGQGSGGVDYGAMTPEDYKATVLKPKEEEFLDQYGGDRQKASFAMSKWRRENDKPVDQFMNTEVGKSVQSGLSKLGNMLGLNKETPTTKIEPTVKSENKPSLSKVIENRTKNKDSNFKIPESTITPIEYTQPNIVPSVVQPRKITLPDLQEANAFQNFRAQPFGGRGFNDGGMAYEDGGEGTIIPGESFSGDHLPDRINSGELVLNLDQQDMVNDVFKALKKLRTDEAVDMGLKDVNKDQQEALFETIKGERPLESLPDNNIIEEQGMKKLLRILGSK